MRRVTLADVAVHAGVSRATASLALRGTGRLSDQTRERVRTSMDELGYVYHRGAASLRAQRTSVVGLLLTDVSNPFFAGMTVGLEEDLARHGYLTMMANTFDRATRQQELLHTMQEHAVDGIVYTPVEDEQGPVGVETTLLPMLAVTRRPRDVDAAYLGPDDRIGGGLAAEHLLWHGRSRIVYLGGPRYGSARRERAAGVDGALRSRPGATLVADLAGRTSIEVGRALAVELLESGIDFDGVVCHSDMVAFAFYSVLRERRPDLAEGGVSVVGFDGLAESAVFEPPLTTVSVGPEAFGRRASERIRAMADQTDPGGVELLRPFLDVRRSCGCPAP